MISKRLRWLLPILALVSTAPWWIEIDLLNQPAAAKNPSQTNPDAIVPSTNSSSALALDRLQPRTSHAPQTDPFALPTHMLTAALPVASAIPAAPAPVEPPPPPPPPPPPKPSAPPLPFSYLGQVDGSEQVIVYLTQGEEVFSVRPGERFAQFYRLDEVRKNKLVILYMPLSVRQYLPIDRES